MMRKKIKTICSNFGEAIGHNPSFIDTLCINCGFFNINQKRYTMDFKNSSIAIATDDGSTVSSHFGRARFYEVLNFSDGKVIKRERREKAEHHSFAQAEGEHDHHDDEGRKHRHQTMVSPIVDCHVVVVRGMGQGAVEHLRRANLLPVLTKLHTIDEVIKAVESGSLDNDPRRIHQNRAGH
jgi:predicted Fe-Mo cluster-binding NifX family protein